MRCYPLWRRCWKSLRRQCFPTLLTNRFNGNRLFARSVRRFSASSHLRPRYFVGRLLHCYIENLIRYRSPVGLPYLSSRQIISLWFSTFLQTHEVETNTSMYTTGNIYLITAIAVIGGGLFGFDISSMSAIISTRPYLCYFNQGPDGPGYNDSLLCSGPKSNTQGGITASMVGIGGETPSSFRLSREFLPRQCSTSPGTFCIEQSLTPSLP